MNTSLYEKLGGKDAVSKAVDVFYERILADPLTRPFFTGVDMTAQKGKQRAFLTMAFGGPTNYTGKDLRSGHAHLLERGLNDRHVDAVKFHLDETLKSLGVPDDWRQDVAQLVEGGRSDVLGR